MRVATIGVFDGVHRGHQALVGRARDWAASGSGRPSVVAVTFDPNPLAVLRPSATPAILTTVPRREELLRLAGADEVIVVEFTPALSEQSPVDFARFLTSAEGLGAEAVVAGSNFRFGKGAAGDTATLAEFGREMGFDVDVLPLITEDVPGQGTVTWSSTYVRQQLAEGEVGLAGHVLGRPHRVEGLVVTGDRRGRELGYPTANTAVVPGMAIPADGVYAGWLVDATDGITYPAAISVGTNPHFEGTERRVEAHVLGRTDLDLYDHHVGVDFVERLRGQAVFGSLEELIAQMSLDTAQAGRILLGE